MRGSMGHMVLSDIYGAWRRQDLELIASYLPDDFCHEIVVPSGMTPFAGLRKTKEQVLERLDSILGQYEIIRFDTSRLMIQGDRAAVHVPITYWHRTTGATLESTLGSFWELEEGWPVRLIEYHDVDRLAGFLAKIRDGS